MGRAGGISSSYFYYHSMNNITQIIFLQCYTGGGRRPRRVGKWGAERGQGRSRGGEGGAGSGEAKLSRGGEGEGGALVILHK